MTLFHRGSCPLCDDPGPGPRCTACGFPTLGTPPPDLSGPFDRYEIRPKPHRYASEMQALFSEGFDVAGIVAWFRPLGVRLTTEDVEGALNVFGPPASMP